MIFIDQSQWLICREIGKLNTVEMFFPYMEEDGWKENLYKSKYCPSFFLNSVLNILVVWIKTFIAVYKCNLKGWI